MGIDAVTASLPAQKTHNTQTGWGSADLIAGFSVSETRSGHYNRAMEFPQPIPSVFPHGRALHRQAGFTVVEVLVALFLMVMIVLAATRATRTTNHVQQSSYYMEQAASYAQAKMAMLQAASLRTVQPGRDTILTPNRIAFSRSWSIVDKGVAKQVEVDVSWSVAGRADTVTMTTLVR